MVDRYTEAAEDARRWLDRAAMCEREGAMHAHCMSEAEAALERAGLRVVGDIGPLLKDTP
jgi:hypothetical protein